MSFASALKAGRVEGWHAHYCDYERLLRLVKACERSASSATAASDELVFVRQCERELSKVIFFLNGQVEEVRTRFGVLKQQCEQLPRRSGHYEASLHATTASAGSSSSGGGGATSCGGGAPRAPLLAGADSWASSNIAAGLAEVAGASGAAGTASDGGDTSTAAGGGQAQPAAFASKAARASARSAYVLLYREARHLESYVLLNSTAFVKAAKKFRNARGASPLVASGLLGPAGELRLHLDAAGGGGGSINGSSSSSSSPAAVRPPDVAPADAGGGVVVGGVGVGGVGGVSGVGGVGVGGGSVVGSIGGSGGGSIGGGSGSACLAADGLGVDARMQAVEACAKGGFGEASGLVSTLLEELEASCGATFHGATASAAEVRAHLLLRLPAESPAGGGAVPRQGFLLGWRVGGATLLLAWLGWDLLIDERLRPDTYCEKKVPGYSLWQDPAIHVYHFSAALLLLEWCWCGMLIVWRRSRINFPFLLELPQTGRTTADNLASASLHSMLFALNMLLFFKVHHHDVFTEQSMHRWNRALPMLLCLGVFVSLVHPWRTRKQIWRLFGEVLIGFFKPVRFVHVFFADWLTSVVKVWVTMAYAACYYTTGEGLNECPQPSNIRQCEQNPVFLNLVLPVLSTLPYVIRLLQCLRMYLDTHKRFPHLANAWKYCFALLIVVIGATHQQWKHLPATGSDIITNLWIVTYAISTSYTYSWDVFMDWGLSFKDGRPYVFACAPLRRDRRMIHPTSWVPYYLAVGADVFLRFLWTLTLAPTTLPFGDFVNYQVKPLLSFAEIMRRAMWSLFRVENEHLNSTLAYKSVPIVPLHFERGAPPRPPEDPSEGPSYRAVALEVFLFIATVLLCYVLSYITHS